MSLQAAGAPKRSARRYDLDWLRVLAVLLLVPFHTALIFSLNPRDVVYIKDTVESHFLVDVDGFIYIWHMPLLFVIAGAATWFALGNRTSGEYIRERTLRLILPALFAFATLIPLMLYIHYIGQPDAPPFLGAYARYFTFNFNDLSGYNGTFTPAHLWFILFLFVFSVLALPLFFYLKGESGQRVIGHLVKWFGKPDMMLFAPAILLAALSLLPSFSDKNPFFFFALFVFGFILMSDPRFQGMLDRQAIGLLLASIVMTVIFYGFVALRADVSRNTTVTVAFGVVYNFCRWSWCIAFIGLGHRVLNASSRLLSYCSEAAYPFYILHLPVNTLVGYFVVRLDASLPIKYELILLLTIALTLAIYDVAIKRFAITRLLFGMKTKAERAAAQQRPLERRPA
jgi:glucan biosynthesis protein C